MHPFSDSKFRSGQMKGDTLASITNKSCWYKYLVILCWGKIFYACFWKPGHLLKWSLKFSCWMSTGWGGCLVLLFTFWQFERNKGWSSDGGALLFLLLKTEGGQFTDVGDRGSNLFGDAKTYLETQAARFLLLIKGKTQVFGNNHRASGMVWSSNWHFSSLQAQLIIIAADNCNIMIRTLPRDI